MCVFIHKVYKDWKEKRFRNTINVYISEKPYYKEKPSENNKEYSLLTLEIIGFVQDNEKHRVPSSGDLLRFKVWGHPKTSGQPKTLENKWNEQFALVKESKPIFNKDGKWLCENYSLFKNESAVQRNIYIFKLTLNIVYKVNICNVKLLEIEKISSLTTTLRQLKALSVLPDNTLCPHVLLPTDQKVFFSQHVNPGDLSSIMNSEQAQAVARIRHAVVTPEPKIFFLQGPAGTGKTHTIVQLIHQILVSTAFRARICLATPSNAAVDEIALRIIQFSNRLKEKKKSHISIVRVGKRDSSHPGVKPYHWEACVERYLSNEKAKHIPGNLQAEYQIYKDRINELTRDLKNPELPSVQKAKFKNDLAECEKKLKGIEKETPKKPTARERYNAKCHVLDNAHVICGTLSSFGVESLKEILSRSEEHRHKAQTFTCLIIDEATQAIEVDSLIPLQYKVNKLILVGDHKQLPATVVSQKANDLELSRSLFERLNLCFEKFYGNLPTQSPIMMLTRQYRMNPEILSLPNNLFYDGRLQTDESVTRRASVLTPYLVFDVEGGKELNASRSHSNVPEAICTAQLCQLIMIALKESTATIGKHIGVICPYIDQRQTILEQLRQLKLDTIEVNTVDGYQGQEKNVIVMSCVRAQSNPTTIGFVADKRRMNVALTRAKNALYVLGHFETLKVNVLWAELQEDAAKRSTLVRIRKVKDFANEAEKRLLKNNPRK